MQIFSQEGVAIGMYKATESTESLSFPLCGLCDLSRKTSGRCVAKKTVHTCFATPHLLSTNNIVAPKGTDQEKVEDQRGEEHGRDEDNGHEPAFGPFVDLRGVWVGGIVQH